MESVEPQSHIKKFNITSENSKWLAENIEGVNQTVKEILRLIEEDDISALNAAEVHYLKKPELIGHVAKVRHMHQLLVKRYNQLIGEGLENYPSLVDMQHSRISDGNSNEISPMKTPDQKLSMQKVEKVDGFNFFQSPVSGSSDVSLKERSEYSLSSSSDSDSESFYSTIKDLVSPMSFDVKGQRPYHKFVAQKELPGIEVDSTAKEREFGDYERALIRITECEEELRIANKKLQFSEKENLRLKAELKKNESIVVLMDNLKGQLDSAQKGIKMRNTNLETEKRKVLELQNQVNLLQSQIDVSETDVWSLREELKMTREQITSFEEEVAKLTYEHCCEISEGTHQFQSRLEFAHREVALLETKLDSEKKHVVELEESTLGYLACLSQRDEEIMELNAALSNSRKTFSLEKEHLQSAISDLLEQQTMLKARVEECEIQMHSCNAEKMEMKAMYDSQGINFKIDIERMKDEVKEKSGLVDATNKNLDILKVKYDMLMAEKDGVNAKVDTLNAELCHRDDKIRELNSHLHQLHIEQVELVSRSEYATKLADELRLKVEELQKEVDRQIAVISDRAEEKREAIRQLCFSLEHYRNGYKELRQAFTGHKQHSILAS